MRKQIQSLLSKWLLFQSGQREGRRRIKKAHNQMEGRALRRGNETRGKEVGGKSHVPVNLVTPHTKALQHQGGAEAHIKGNWGIVIVKVKGKKKFRAVKGHKGIHSLEETGGNAAWAAGRVTSPRGRKRKI